MAITLKLLSLALTLIWNTESTILSNDDKDFEHREYFLSFQPDGTLSNETFATFLGTLPWMGEMTICYWFRIHFHHQTMSLASYCAPANNCRPTTQAPKCSNIQYHVNGYRWDELRVEFSINAVKTKTLRAKLNPKTWNHHCITYSFSSGEVKVFSDGKLESRSTLNTDIFASGNLKGLHPAFPAEGVLILGQEQEKVCGGFDDYDSFSGDISEFQIWNKTLSDEKILKLGSCQLYEQGNVFSWVDSFSKWNMSRAKAVERQDLRNEFCDSMKASMTLAVFPDMRILEEADYLCKIHGGILPVPRNSYENKLMAATGKQYEPVCSDPGKANLNQPYMWLGIEDNRGSGVWMDRNTGEKVKYSNWDENEGKEGDNCARMLGNGVWRDTVCKKSVQHCITCHIVDQEQVFTLRGLCPESQVDRGFFLRHGLDEEVEKTKMKPIYEGSFSKINWIEPQFVDGYTNYTDSNGRWELKSRIRLPEKDAYFAMTNVSTRLGYPIGRHLWLVTDPKCELFEATWLNLTLSRCQENEFTCADGSCIPNQQRCDLVQNCDDFSDELDCETVIVPKTYLHNPPTNQNDDKPVEVSLSVNILNIDKIDTVNMMFALTMEINLEWRDHRLRFKNLREGLGQNQLTQDEIDKIWKPTVGFTNAKIGQLEIQEIGLMVRRETEAEPFSYTSPVEDKIYKGKDNSLVLSRKYYAEYGCTFDLRNFPFDDQRCTMNFTMDSAKASYIILNPENITYQGEILLLEFFINSISAHPAPLVTDSGKSMVSVYIKFHRELGNMVNTYFQTFLLCLMSYLTLYINLADFGNRFMGALTSLLVLASLLASIEENLPKTSYFKKIDIWFMSYIIFIFIIIVFHIWVDFCTGHRDEVIENCDTHVNARITKAKAIFLNNVGKVVFPIILAIFTILYFVLSLV